MLTGLKYHILFSIVYLLDSDKKQLSNFKLYYLSFKMKYITWLYYRMGNDWKSKNMVVVILFDLYP